MQRQDKQNKKAKFIRNISAEFKNSKTLGLLFRFILAFIFVFIFYSWISKAPETDQPYTLKKVEESPYKFVIPTFKEFYETESLRVKIDTSTMNFIVENKKSNYTWHSALELEDEELNESWKMFFNSALTVEFYDNAGSIRREYSTRDATILLKSKDDRIIKFSVNFEKIGISFDLSISILNDTIKVNIDNITEKEFPLMSLFIYPYLGASRDLADGRFLLADGVGAVIDLSKKTLASAPFKMRMYGEDFGFKEVTTQNYFKNIKEPEKYLLPMYGILYKQDGMLTIIKDNEEYSEIHAYKSGIVTPYNWISSKLIFRSMHKKLLNKQGQGITIPQEKINTLKPKIQYHFLDNANEFTIAKRFVDEEKESVKKKLESEKTPIFKFDILMAEAKKTAFGYSLITMTTQEHLEIIKKEFSNFIPSTLYVLRGFSRGGYSRNSPNHLPFEKNVINSAKSLKNDYFYLDYITFPKESKHAKKTIVAQNKLEQLMEVDGYYLIKPELSLDISKSELEKFKKEEIKNFAFGALGKILYSTKWDGRAKVKENFQKIASSVKGQINYGANWYLLSVLDESAMIADVPLEHSGYEIEDDSFPIVPYVLKKFRTIFSKSLNLTSDYELNLLKCIEYGVMPSFYLTWENSKALLDTHSQELISTKFEDWRENIKKTYVKYNKIHKLIRESAPISRTKIYNNVYLLKYDNGTIIVFNYNDYPVKYNEVTIKGRTYEILKYPSDNTL